MTYVRYGQSFWHGIKLNTIYAYFVTIYCIYSPNQDFVVDKIEDILWYVKLLKTISLGSPVYMCYELSEAKVDISEFVVIVLCYGSIKHHPTDTLFFYSEHKCYGSLSLVTFTKRILLYILQHCFIMQYYSLLWFTLFVYTAIWIYLGITYGCM